MSVLRGAVLVLNKSWSAVHVATVRRAICLVYRGLASVVDPESYSTYDFETWKRTSTSADGNCIRSAKFKLTMPEVIQIPRAGGRRRQKIRFSRRSILERDRYTCQYCGRRFPAGELSLDHVVPRCRDGNSRWDNLVAACRRCNDRKRDRLPEEAGLTLRKTPSRPSWKAYLSARLGPRWRESWTRFLDGTVLESELRT